MRFILDVRFLSAHSRGQQPANVHFITSHTHLFLLRCKGFAYHFDPDYCPVCRLDHNGELFYRCLNSNFVLYFSMFKISNKVY